MCGNTSIPLLTPGDPHFIKYASSWVPNPGGRLNPPHTDCFWYIQAPNDSIIEVNVISSNGVGPAISLGAATEAGVTEASGRLFYIPPGYLQILYTNQTRLWMMGDISPIEYYRTAVCEIKITAFTKHGIYKVEYKSTKAVLKRGCLPSIDFIWSQCSRSPFIFIWNI